MYLVYLPLKPCASMYWEIGRQNNLVTLETDRLAFPISSLILEVFSLQWPRHWDLYPESMHAVITMSHNCPLLISRLFKPKCAQSTAHSVIVVVKEWLSWYHSESLSSLLMYCFLSIEYFSSSTHSQLTFQFPYPAGCLSSSSSGFAGPSDSLLPHWCHHKLTYFGKVNYHWFLLYINELCFSLVTMPFLVDLSSK